MESDSTPHETPGHDFTSGLPAMPPAPSDDETPTGDTSTEEAPAVGEDLTGDGSTLPNEAGDATGDGTNELTEEELASATDPDPDPDPDDEDLLGSGEGDELRSVEPTVRIADEGQRKHHERQAAALASRGEAPFATNAMADMVDYGASGATTVKAAVTSAEAAAVAAMAASAATASAAATAWREERGIEIEDRYTRPITQTQD